MESVEHPDVGTVSARRDADGRLIEVTGRGLLRRWVRDGGGRPITYREEIAGRVSVTELSWDARGRLIREKSDGGSRRYRYGQLIGMEGPDDSWSWSYDADGCLVREVGPEGEKVFVYDEASQLVEVDNGHTVTRFEYDGLGRRAGERSDDGSSVTYSWDGLGHLRRIARQPADGVASVTHLDVGPLGQLTTVDGQRLDWLRSRRGSGVARRERCRHLRRPSGATSQSGDVRWISADWSGSVGDSPSPWGPGPSDGSGPRLGWAGEVEAGGVVWLRNRAYDPATRAFLSRDPLAGEPTRPGGLANPYQYASNDPVNRRDPSGLKPVTAAEADKQIAS